MNKSLLFLPILLLVGCATTKPSIITKTVEVKVPVQVPCKVKPVPKPNMPLKSLDPSSNIYDKVKTALAEIEIRKGYETNLEAAIKSCE